MQQTKIYFPLIFISLEDAVYKAFDYKELCRKTSTFEYNTVIDAVNKYGFEGFVQSRTSAAKDFIPKFYDEKYY